MLEVSNLVCRQGNFKVTADKIYIPSGSIHCLMGKSGSGKSTLLMGICGFVPLDKGKVILNGRMVQDLPPEKRQIALVFQRSSLFSKMTVYQNIAFGLQIMGVDSSLIEKRVTHLLDRLKISHLIHRLPHQISGGEAQRVALARALAPEFPTLLLDEPFSALDVELREDLRQLLKQLVTEYNISALLVTHDPEDTRFFGEKVYRIVDGRCD